jgi:hypothetical protein
MIRISCRGPSFHSGRDARTRDRPLAVWLLSAFASSGFCVGAAIAGSSFQRERVFTMSLALFAIAAIIFNSIVPLRMTRGVWSILNIIGVVIYTSDISQQSTQKLTARAGFGSTLGDYIAAHHNARYLLGIDFRRPSFPKRRVWGLTEGTKPGSEAGPGGSLLGSPIAGGFSDRCALSKFWTARRYGQCGKILAAPS